MAQPSARRGHRLCKLGPLVERSGGSQGGMDNSAAAIESCEREGEVGVIPGANAENAAGAGDLGTDETVDDVDEDAAANADADADEEEAEGQEVEVEGVIGSNDNAVQPLCS
ncbi:hypothetical protein FRC12_004733 [Ceratobasidium sp. 428]|nr:hypothetical protein FRC12_004733 [Ceratobasidium sp. 428]